MYRVDMAELRAELKRRNWDIADLAAIWRVKPSVAAACLARPQQLSCRQMLLLQQAAGWDAARAAKIFFATHAADTP